MKKLYVNEIYPNGEVSTVGLFYSSGEAEGIVKKLQELPEKRSCKYAITETPPRSAAIAPRREKQQQAEE